MSIFQAERQIRIHTPLGPNKLLVDRLQLDEALGRLFEVQVELLSEDDSIPHDDLLGKKVDIELDTIHGGTRIINAFVTEFIQVGIIGDLFHYRATLHPWVWFLTRTADCRIYQNLDATAIIQEIFGQNGFSDFELRLSHSYRTREYCVQFRETDFNFISRLMEEEGIYYFFTHKAGKHTLVLCDDYASHTPLSDGPSVLSFDPTPGSGGQRSKEIVSNWRIHKGVRSGRYAHTDYDFKKPKADLQSVAPMPQSHPYADYEIFDYPGTYVEHSDGDQYARSRIEALQASYEQLQGECDIRHLSVGGLFNLMNHPRLDQNREYLVTRASYRIQADDYRTATGNSEGPTYHCDFSCIHSKVSFRTERTTRKPKVEGAQTAVVVGPAGEEIYSDEYGRVKVQFFWDRYGEMNENSSCWIRVSQEWAGKNYGSMHVPRIGQEVIIDFLDGDPDRPIITGRVYNADQMPPWGLPANQTQSGILTRSSKGGSGANANALRFEDKMGEEEVWLHAEKDQRIEVENDESHWVGHDRTKTIDHDETSHIKHDRTETVDNNETITVHNNRTERVDHNETISIGDNRTEDVGKDETISIGKNRTETVGSNETISIGDNRTEIVGKNESVTIGKNRTKSVADNESISVGGNASISVGGSSTETVSQAKAETIIMAKALTVGVGYQVSVGGAMNTTVGMTKSEQVVLSKSTSVGTSYSITAGDELSMSIGDASIVLKSDGTIDITGVKINITASDSINFSSPKINNN